MTLKTALLGIWLLSPWAQVFAQVDTTQQAVAGRVNSKEQMQKPYVILISVDGFRYDYAQKFGAENILKLASGGIKAASLIPSFPSLTFPNHYTLVTGLYPSHTGLVANYFYDPKRKDNYGMSQKNKVKDGSWYGGTPLWVLAEQQQMLSASFYWVGSEADIQQTRPTYYYHYNEDIEIDKRIRVVKDWLQLPEEKRPHLITFYFSEVDHAGHDFGPDAPETRAAVKDIDVQIGKLTQAVAETGLPVNFILVSDHGMTAVDRENPIRTPEQIDKKQFVVASSGTLINLHAHDPSYILPLYAKLKATAKDYEVYLKKDMPKRLHYGAKDDRFNRIGDIVLLAKWPKVFSDRKPGVGYHGFDPAVVKEMGATFYAWGPAFKTGLSIPSFQNIHVYPIITEILDLKQTRKIDGKDEVADKILKE